MATITRSKRTRKTTPPGATNARKIKRTGAIQPESQPNEPRTNNPGSSNQPDDNSNAPMQPTTTDPGELDITEIDIFNYAEQKKYWPNQRIIEQLNRQTSKNQSQPSPLIIAEAIAIHDAFQHSLLMLAMVGNVKVDVLKSHLGMQGASCASNPWIRFLSFCNLAYRLPMPGRGDPDAGEILSARNEANSVAYQQLNDDEHAIFTARIFHALGGYPDYSAVLVEDNDTAGDFDVLIPEVPKLAPEEEALYRPLYDKLIDPAKVDKDRKRFQAPSAAKKEKRSMQVFKKRLQQLHQEAVLADFDYYAIGCSKTLGNGWCEEYTSIPAISTWLEDRFKFQVIFPLYSQGKPAINEIEAVAAAAAVKGNAKKTKAPNKSDLELTELSQWLTTTLVALAGPLPTRGFPRGRNPPAIFEKHNINVDFIRHPDSSMTNDEFLLGFDEMKTIGRRHWLQDVKDGKFTMVRREPPPPGESSHGYRSGETEGSGRAGGSVENLNSGTEVEEAGGRASTDEGSGPVNQGQAGLQTCTTG